MDCPGCRAGDLVDVPGDAPDVEVRVEQGAGQQNLALPLPLFRQQRIYTFDGGSSEGGHAPGGIEAVVDKQVAWMGGTVRGCGHGVLSQ